MFKKKKKDKQKGQVDKNQKNLSNNNGSMSNQLYDELDGFDKNGFVDLQPIESDATVLGPRQKCKYVGTFAVVSGTDGRQTLKTHKERTSFVKDRLCEYRDKFNGVDVVLQMSSEGIKVFNFDASRVRMAYPLQRISFATCDPDFYLFAFMTYSPTPEGVAVHGHVFFGQSSKQVQDLTAMIGKAFKLAFASSKLQKRHGMDAEDLVPSPTRPAKRWAKHELHRGHDHSEHASYAKDKKKGFNTSTSSEVSTSSERKTPTTGKPGWRHGPPLNTPPSQRKHKGLSLGSRFAGDDDAVSDSISEMSISTTTSTTRSVYEAEEITSTEITLSDLSPPLPYSSHKELDVSNNYPGAKDNEQLYETVDDNPSDMAPPVPPRNHISVERTQSDPVNSQRPITMTEELLLESSSQRGASSGSIPAKVMYVPSGDDDQNTEGKKRSDTIERPATHHDEYWYMPGIPREFILEMLQSSEDGSFFVRDSHSRPGSHALTVRVPVDFIPDGYANYLITSAPEGVKLEGFSKAFPDLMTLIEHYSCQADELPCKLTLAGSNMLCEDEEESLAYTEHADPDYRLLSDFHSMMDELKY